MKMLHKISLALIAALSLVSSANARMYDPKTGRWLSRDPVGEKGGRNLYVLCFNDAIDKTDPFGLKIFNKSCYAVLYKDERTSKVHVLGPEKDHKGEQDGLIEPKSKRVVKTVGRDDILVAFKYHDDVDVDRDGTVRDLDYGSGYYSAFDHRAYEERLGNIDTGWDPLFDLADGELFKPRNLRPVVFPPLHLDWQPDPSFPSLLGAWPSRL
jgi:hypothetical protein